MKKRYIIVSLISLILVLAFIIVLSNNGHKTFKEDGITYALMVDGNSVTSVPDKGMYQVDTNCDGATGKWDYDNWKLYVENITGNVECDISFNSISKEYLNQKIISLSGTTQGKGELVEENGYRYEGKNPNNFIWFNNELWRIIGVFDSSSHGQIGENLVKLIRENSLGKLVWDKSNTNNWETSSLKALLNGAYYNQEDGTDSGYCYGNSSVSSNCDYTEIGIDSSYRSMIKNVTWYLGGYGNYGKIADVYINERGTKVYTGNPTSEEGYIGLMYLSDYGYSPLASSCPRTVNLSAYGSLDLCSGQSWLNKGLEWTLCPVSGRGDYVLNIRYNNSKYTSGSNRASNGYGVRPVLYLDASVYVLDGDGSRLNPYIIGM